jgi:hypothetical protein
MRLLWFPILAALATPAAAAPLPPPLTPAAVGQLQCYVPDIAHKTCQLLASYGRDKAGMIQNVATVAVSRDPPIAMTTTAPVDVKDGRVCGPVRPEDFAAATFTIGGQPADLRQTADLRLHVADGMKAIIGHVICATYVKSGEAWVAKSTLDGAPQPDGDEAFIWVAANAGWKVAP